MKILIYGNESSSATTTEIIGATETYDLQKEFYRDLKKYVTKSNQPSQGGARSPETKVMDFLHRTKTATYAGYITTDSAVDGYSPTYAYEVRDKIESYVVNGGPVGLKVTSNDGSTATLLDWNTTKQAYITKISCRTTNQDEDIPSQYEITIQLLNAIQQ